MSNTTYEPCLLCEKAVNVTKRHWRAHVIDLFGGTEVDQGWHAIGPECRRDSMYPVERWEGGE